MRHAGGKEPKRGFQFDSVYIRKLQPDWWHNIVVLTVSSGFQTAGSRLYMSSSI